MNCSWGSLIEDSSIFDKIQEFVTPIRLEILRALYDDDKPPSQGELALQLSLKPTALANRLLKFDSFTPKLLEKIYEGKFCYYTLSEWGRRYMDRFAEAEKAQVQESTALLDRQDEILHRVGPGERGGLAMNGGKLLTMSWCVIRLAADLRRTAPQKN